MWFCHECEPFVDFIRRIDERETYVETVIIEEDMVFLMILLEQL